MKTIKEKKLKTRNSQQTALIIMALPFLVFFCLFTIIPIFVAIFLSFTDFNLVSINNFVGIDHYIRMFLSDKIFLKGLTNTFILAIITGPVGYILSFVFAWLINEIPKKVRAFVTFCIYAPSLTSSVYVIWKYIFASDS